MVNVRYSEITQEKLNNYYEKFFLSKKNVKKAECINFIQVCLYTLLFLAALMGITTYFWTYCYKIMHHVFHISSNPLIEVVLAIAITLLLAVIILIFVFFHLSEFIDNKLPLTQRYRRERALRKELGKYREILIFQETLKGEKRPFKVLDAGNRLVIFPETPGVVSGIVLNLENPDWKKKIVTKEFAEELDFTWLDDEIKNIVFNATGRTLEGIMIHYISKSIQKDR